MDLLLTIMDTEEHPLCRYHVIRLVVMPMFSSPMVATVIAANTYGILAIMDFESDNWMRFACEVVIWVAATYLVWFLMNLGLNKAEVRKHESSSLTRVSR